ncbi:GNAT family N-acetyltransferase [Paenibacillus lemnae]|uniref:GNAT family N-acetyltransferase n=1 Tax=Paenibacillus lemnae TaxID=1330551 RepID=A0A848M0R9_PAELE|nr:GNAT family N-acetyltransferase [Paenibacillus lemnae]NMO94518.1 GNAT family N-acetyltransferase [Paenibacillus lemnae]
MDTCQRLITIRFSELKDAARLMELDHLVWDRNTAPEPLNWESREHYLLHCPPGSQLVAVTDSEEIAGYLGFRPPTGLDSSAHVYELWIAVDPAFQRQGIGSRLMHAFQKAARQEGKSKLRLRVLSSNPRAIAFYRSCGFKEEGRLVREYCVQGRYLDDILMSCFLSD